MTTKFRVMRGIHAEGGKVYRQGEVVDSKTDLSKHNSPGATKFERVEEPGVKASPGVPVSKLHDAPPVRQAPPPQAADELRRNLHADLDKMSVEKLREYAAEEEIDLKGAATREAILKIVKAI